MVQKYNSLSEQGPGKTKAAEDCLLMLKTSRITTQLLQS